MKNIKEKIVTPLIYTEEYYREDNEGHREYLNICNKKEGKIHDKFERALKLAQIKKGENVLDVGCGRGELIYYAIEKGASHVLGIDYSEAAIKIAKETILFLPEKDQVKAEAHVSTSEAFTYTQKYDVIFFLEIAEHMHDWQLQETFIKFNQILTANGRIIMITPNDSYEQYLRPITILMMIPGNFWKWPIRILAGKYKPKSFKEFLSRVFKWRIDRGDIHCQMHCNVMTPKSIKNHLTMFNAHVYCEGHSPSLLARFTVKWFGRDIIAIAQKK